MNTESLWSAVIGLLLAGYGVYVLLYQVAGTGADIWHGVILLLIGLGYVALAVPTVQAKFDRLPERRSVRILGGVLLIGVGFVWGGLYSVVLGGVGLILIVFTLLGAQWR